MEQGPGVKYAKVEFVPYALEKGNGGDVHAPHEVLRLLRHWGLVLYNIHWRGGIEGEFFCYDELELLHAEHDEVLFFFCVCVVDQGLRLSDMPSTFEASNCPRRCVCVCVCVCLFRCVCVFV